MPVLAGGGQVQQPGGQPGGLPAAQPPGGPAGAAQPGPGDRAGQHLQHGVLAVAERGGGPGQRPQRVRGKAGAQRQDLGPREPQRPAGGQHPGGQRGAGRGGSDGVRAGPGRFHGPLDQAGRDDARHPHADPHPAAGPAGPGVFPAQVRLAVPPAGPGRAQQPGQVPPQRLGAGRVGLRRGEDDHLPGAVGEHLVAAAPQLRPPGDHRGGGCGQHRARGRTPRGEGVQQQPGQPGGRPAGVGHVPAQRPARPARRDQQPVPGHGSMSSSASPGSGGAAAAPAGCWRACRRAISAGSDWCTRRFLPATPGPRRRPGRTGRPPGARFPWPPTGAGIVPRRTGGTRRRPC